MTSLMDAEAYSVSQYGFSDDRLLELRKTSSADHQTLLYVSESIPHAQYAAWQGPLLCGYFPAVADRIDQILEAARATIRPTREPLKGTECVVVDAEKDDAHYTVWFSPSRDGCILRMIRVQEGSMLRRQAEKTKFDGHDAGPTNSRVLRVVQQVDDVAVLRFGASWIPVAGKYTEEITYDQGPPSLLSTMIRRERVELNPDTSGVLFAPIVLDGTRVRFVGRPNALPWQWRDGKIVPLEDQQATQRLRELVESNRFVSGAKEASKLRLLRGPACFLALVLVAATVVWLLARPA